MRLTFQALGLTLDLSLAPTTAEAEDDPLRDLGATGSTPVGFVHAHEIPDDASIHRPTSPWEDDSEARR